MKISLCLVHSLLEKIEILSGGICDLGILRDDVSLSSAAVLPGWEVFVSGRIAGESAGRFAAAKDDFEALPDIPPKREEFNTDILDRYFTVLPDGKKTPSGIERVGKSASNSGGVLPETGHCRSAERNLIKITCPRCKDCRIYTRPCAKRGQIGFCCNVYSRDLIFMLIA